MHKKTIYLLLLVFTSSCNIIFHSQNKNIPYHLPSINNNVCKKLKGDVLVYGIFVDTKFTYPWTEHDIVTTIDSIERALSWIENKACENCIDLAIDFVYHSNNGIIPISQNLSKKSLSATVFTSGVKTIDRWADKISKEASSSLGNDSSKLTKTKIKSANREKLIARLRDIYKVDNVALIFFVNNYFTDDFSFAFHTNEDYNIEYSIVSYKNPAVIAHEFLHLFGAIDLYITPFDKNRKVKKKKAFAMKEFPDEIMAFTHRKIDTLNISPFTQYAIGWTRSLDDKYKEMLFGKKIKIARY
ncbi:hypothetical protein ACFLTE_09340 [Bacteroidota bacterium]